MHANAIGHRIRALRLARGWTVPELARRVGCSRQAVEHWESGRREPPVKNLGAIATALGVEVEIRLVPVAHDIDDNAAEILVRLAEVLRHVPPERRRVLVAQVMELEERYLPPPKSA